MDVLGYTIDTVLEWVLAGVVFLLAIIAAFYVGRFLLRYTTGMVGGFILLLVGMGMILGPSFYLISTDDVPTLRIILSATSIFIGCAAVLAGAFSLTSFRDF